MPSFFVRLWDPSASRLILLFVFFGICAAISPVLSFLWIKEIKPTTNIRCAYASSGQYSLLQRTNYYFLLIAAVLVHSKEWLVGGAFAAVMVYAGVTAIHALVLACISAT